MKSLIWCICDVNRKEMNKKKTPTNNNRRKFNKIKSNDNLNEPIHFVPWVMLQYFIIFFSALAVEST